MENTTSQREVIENNTFTYSLEGLYLLCVEGKKNNRLYNNSSESSLIVFEHIREVVRIKLAGLKDVDIVLIL